MIGRSLSTYFALCACGTRISGSVISGDQTFAAMTRLMLSSGWRTEKDHKGRYTHTCPECVAKEAR